MKSLPSPLLFGFLLLLFLSGIVLRGLFLPAKSGDMIWFLIPWYDFLKVNGFQGFGTKFSNYTPPYLYLLWLATLTSTYVPKIIAIKMISIFADMVNAFWIYRLARLKYPSGFKPVLAGLPVDSANRYGQQ